MALLVVLDDQEAVRLALGRTLLRAGHEVIVVGKGEEAIRECSTRDVELLIADVALGDMFGVDAALWSTLARPGLKILYISGYPEEELRRLGLPEGAPFLQKPIEATVLLETVARMLGSRGTTSGTQGAGER